MKSMPNKANPYRAHLRGSRDETRKPPNTINTTLTTHS
jgi:hypothetical protein